MTWIVTANTNLYRIYHYDKNPEKITLVKEVNHPENKLKKEALLTTERPGHYQKGATVRGSYEPATDPKDVEIDNFSRELALDLNHGRTMNAYSQLIIITPPHMQGLLSAHLDKHVKALVKREIQKDVTQLSPKDFLEFLKSHLKPE